MKQAPSLHLSAAPFADRRCGRQLRYTSAEELTIRRRRSGKKWQYFHDDGTRVTDKAEIARLDAIALPPAYGMARFNSDPDGHLQAIGHDARGRRQYRYHPLYRAAQDDAKFANCIDFGRLLGNVRKRIQADLAAPSTSRQAVLAAMVHILDLAFLRIGNEAYCQANKSYGLSTLRNRHARLRGQSLQLDYRGKGGIKRTVRLSDRSLSRIVRRCQDLPGQRLFQYLDDSGAVRALNSDDVNSYLRDVSGEDFTAKHFRTWHASVIAFAALREGRGGKEMLLAVAEALGNTPAIARKSYIHPALLETDADMIRTVKLPRATRWSSRAERGFLQWLSLRQTKNKSD